MSRSDRRGALAAACLAAACAACASEPPAPEGVATGAAALETDPVGALRRGVDELGAVADEAEIARRVRDLVALLSRDAFDPWPDPRARLRLELVYVMNPPEPGERAAALARARALTAKLRRRRGIRGGPVTRRRR